MRRHLILPITRNFLKVSNEIFKIIFKHKLYEFCIDIIFKHILRNFPSDVRRIPEVGEKYTYIRETVINEKYYNCVVISPEKLEDYNLLDEEEQNDLAFAITYKKLVYNDDDGNIIEIFGDSDNITKNGTRDGYQYFTFSEMDILEFRF